MANPRIRTAVFINGPQKVAAADLAEQKQVKVAVPGPDERYDPNAWDNAARQTAADIDRLLDKREPPP